MRTASTLELALLSLLQQQPRSGYDLRRAFATTPLTHFSDSPGAIYPALQRLRRRGWIRLAPRMRQRSGRGKRTMAPTPRGLAAWRTWLRRPVARPDIIWGMDEVMLRFAFLEEGVSRRAAARLLASLQKQIAAYLPTLEAYAAEAAASMPLSGRLALQSGIEGYRARARWARRAEKRLNRSQHKGAGAKRARRRRRARSSR